MEPHWFQTPRPPHCEIQAFIWHILPSNFHLEYVFCLFCLHIIIMFPVFSEILSKTLTLIINVKTFSVLILYMWRTELMHEATTNPSFNVHHLI